MTETITEAQLEHYRMRVGTLRKKEGKALDEKFWTSVDIEMRLFMHNNTTVRLSLQKICFSL